LKQTAVDFRAERKALVERITVARIVGDFDYLESASAPDIIVKLIGAPDLFPYCGEYHGRRDARQALEQAHIEFSFHDMKLDHILIDGEKVAVRWRGTLRNRGTGASGHFEGFTHLIFEAGLIKEYFTFIDTAAMRALAQPD